MSNDSPHFVVIRGNPVDGFSVEGVFDTPADATEYADSNLDKPWWVMPLDVVTPIPFRLTGPLRDSIADIVERVAKEGLPGPRDLDVALDAIECAIKETSPGEE